jgi:outer membrane protein assembly factor BamB
VWNNRVFVSGDNKIFYCFNKNNGDSLLSFKADAPIRVTPKVSDDKVYFGTLNRTCYALDANTGEFKWSYQGGGSILFEPSFYQNYVMFKASGALLVLDKNSGKELFKMSDSTTKFDFENAYWDADGKIYAGGYRNSDQQPILIAYQFK